MKHFSYHIDILNSQSDQILNQDRCDMYLGLFYTNYYKGLNDTSYEFKFKFFRYTIIYQTLLQF